MQFMKKASVTTLKFLKNAPKIIEDVIKAAVWGIKAIITAIVVGSWIAVFIIAEI